MTHDTSLWNHDTSIWNLWVVSNDARYCGLSEGEVNDQYWVPHIVHLDAVPMEWWVDNARVNFPPLW